MTQQQEWGAALHQRIAGAIRTARQGRMSAQQLADETERLGYPISRSQIANYESGRKQGLDVAELLVLAAALEVPPVTLLFGGPPDEEVEMLPDWTGPAFFGIAWFSGDRELAWPGPEVIDPDDARDQAHEAVADPDSTAVKLLGLVRQRAKKHGDLAMLRFASKRDMATWDDATFDARLIGEINEITDAIAKVVADSQGDAE